MKEEFLHYLWRYRLFQLREARTLDGDPLEVLHPGHPHQDGGPDLQNARLRIGDTLWAGNVEIHFRSSQWYEHGHHRDPAYDNVILHVVLEADRDCYSSRGVRLDTLEVKGRIPEGIARAYQRFMNDERSSIPCEASLPEVPPPVLRSQIDRALMERLEKKRERIHRLWNLSEKDPRECFYRLLARYFGGRVNATPFEELAIRTPLQLLLREREQLGTLEAILFGQSGLLPKTEKDAYAAALEKEYRFQKRKYGLKPMDPSGWRFLRSRPANFPTVRIAQFAALFHERGDPYALLRDAQKENELLKIFDLKASDYWREHYKFGKERKRRSSGKIGAMMKQRLLINAFIPFLYFIGELWDEAERKERAVALLEGLSPEDDRVNRKWKELGVFPENAARSQGLIELREAYCEARNCLKCEVGDRILKRRTP